MWGGVILWGVLPVDMVWGIFWLAITIGLGAAWLWVWIPRAKKYVCRMGTIRMGVTFRRPNFHTVWEKIVEGVKRFAREKPWGSFNLFLFGLLLADRRFFQGGISRMIQDIPGGAECLILWLAAWVMFWCLALGREMRTTRHFTVDSVCLLVGLGMALLGAITTCMLLAPKGLFYLMVAIVLGFAFLYNIIWRFISHTRSLLIRLSYGYSFYVLFSVYCAFTLFLYTVYADYAQGVRGEPLTEQDLWLGIVQVLEILMDKSFVHDFFKNGKFHWDSLVQGLLAGYGALLVICMKTLVSVRDEDRDGTDIEADRCKKQKEDGSTANYGAC